MKLSIITINLNNEEGLRKTVESVKKQTFTDFEFLVIDGGSKDGSIDIIQENKQHINYWVSERDKGIYNAMNKGIKVAKGEYCYFLNSGDYLQGDDVLKKIFDNKEEDSAFICGNFTTEKKGVQQRFTEYKNRDWSFSLYEIYAGFVAHQAFFIKREMFDKYGFYDEGLRIMSDWKLFFIAIGIHHEKVVYKDVDLVIYDMDGLSSHIGGKVINSEKKLVAKAELPEAVFARLSRLNYLEKNGFIIDFIHSKKWIHFLFRAFLKCCKTLGIAKF